MADHYDQLTEDEKAYWDVYTRLRELSDWSGFTDGQASVKEDSRDWLVNQRKTIWRMAQPESDGGDGGGWNKNNRSERYQQLKDDSLNTGSCRRVCQLPTNGGTPSEKAKISEREMWWRVESVDDTTKRWRQANADWCTSRRKQVWHLGEDEGWDEAERELRYDNLCVATKTGAPYDEWAKTHNTTTGEAKDTGGGSGKGREACKDWLNKYVGVSENPKGSNKGQPQPSGWQNRVYGDDGVPWCACFSVCSAWDNGVSGTGTAGVYNNVQLAKQGNGIYRGWTSDASKVRPGDHLFIGSDHTGVAYGTLQNDGTILGVEGNTSGATSSGSQWNGDVVAKKTRSASYWSAGFGLVDFKE